MRQPMFVIEIEAVLLQYGFRFHLKSLPHGIQFRFGDGAILNAYPTGRTYWQGRRTGTRYEVDRLVEQVRQKYWPYR